MRAEWLGTIEYMGWSPLQYAIANLYDLVQTIAFSFGGKRMPDSARYPRPKPPEKAVTTIAEFNIESFMRTLAS